MRTSFINFEALIRVLGADKAIKIAQQESQKPINQVDLNGKAVKVFPQQWDAVDERWIRFTLEEDFVPLDRS
jgi:hypothetical protein